MVSEESIKRAMRHMEQAYQEMGRGEDETMDLTIPDALRDMWESLAMMLIDRSDTPEQAIKYVRDRADRTDSNYRPID